MSLLLILALALLLGMVHGIAPDEHTWPITFSYAIGSYSRRGGMRAGFLFSLSFTLQRALACELAWFALSPFLRSPGWNAMTALIVGAVMLASGVYILRRCRIPHLLHSHHLGYPQAERADARAWLPLLHGFIAGWGTGAFALVVYATLVPATHSPWLAFTPGLAFGLGTMLMQVIIGAAVGGWMARRKLSDAARTRAAQLTAGRTLLAGGGAFCLLGAAQLFLPARAAAWLAWTPLPHLHLELGLVLVLGAVAAAAWLTLASALRAKDGTGLRCDEGI